MTPRNAIYALTAVLALSIPTLAFPIMVKGTVHDNDGKSIRGAIVTLTAEKGLYSESVYSDDNGDFQLDTGLHGDLTLRVRKPSYADSSHPIKVEGSNELHEKFIMHSLVSAQEISDSLTASAHFSTIKFDDPDTRHFFQLDCVTCHQVGNEFTRSKRTLEQWTAIVTRMVGFLGDKNEQTIARYASALAKAFDGKPLALQQSERLDPTVLGVRIREWKLPSGAIAHDTEVNPDDGKFYTVDEGNDQIYITDPVSNSTETVRLPALDVPIGGKFMELFGDPKPLGLSVSHGPHSLQRGHDGRFYTTNAIGGDIGAFDPVTRKYEVYPVGGNGLYPHTLRVDLHGAIWFTLSVSNQVARFDPVKKEMKIIELPDTMIREDGPKGFPYGIDISPVDGSIWYTRLYANKVGRIDPMTLAVQEFDPPLIGPRRLRFSADGILWIPAFGDGKLVRLDPATMKYTSYPLPVLSPEEVEAPYAVAIHPQTQDVWITANMSDRIFRFLPAEERFITYPLATRGTYLREIFFTETGSVCAPSSPMPAMESVVEGGMQGIFCIDPASPKTTHRLTGNN